jgi:hypothetical protein
MTIIRGWRRSDKSFRVLPGRRIADHAANIAEMVVYLAEGKNIRHAPPSQS